MVSAPVIAKERGISVEETRARQPAPMRARSRDRGHRAAGALGVRYGVLRRQAAHHPDQGHQHGGRARPLHALCHQSRQARLHRPLSCTLGEAGINIATFHLGRQAPGGDAIALVEIDGDLPPDVLAAIVSCRRCSRRDRWSFERSGASRYAHAAVGRALASSRWLPVTLLPRRPRLQAEGRVVRIDLPAHAAELSRQCGGVLGDLRPAFHDSLQADGTPKDGR